MVSVILWSTVRNYVWLSSLFLSLSSLSTWNFLSAESKEGIFCYVIEVTLEPHLRMSAGCQWSQPSNWRLRIFSRHLTSWKGRGAGCGIDHRWFHQSYFCNEASTKLKGQGSESFWVSEPLEVLGKWCPGEGMEAPNPFPIPFLYMSLVWLFPSYTLFW